MKKLAFLVGLILLSALVFSQENPLVGEWRIDKGSKYTSIVFDNHYKCVLSNKSDTISFFYAIRDDIVLINELGYYFEFLDKNIVKLTPAFGGESPIILIVKK